MGEDTVRSSSRYGYITAVVWARMMNAPSHSLLLCDIIMYETFCYSACGDNTVLLSAYENHFVTEEKLICYQLELGKQLADVLTECSSHHQDSPNVGELFSQPKLLTNNFLFIHAEANWEAAAIFCYCWGHNCSVQLLATSCTCTITVTISVTDYHTSCKFFFMTLVVPRQSLQHQFKQ